MQRPAFMFFAVAVVASTAFVIATGQDLPARVASHFGFGGAADRYLSRETYVLVIASITALVPIVTVAVAAITARVRPGGACRRHRAFWSRPENRDAAIAWCTSRSMVLGGMVAIFLAAVHALVLRANEVQPAHLPSPLFGFVVAAFGVAVAVVSLMFRLHMDRIVRGTSH